MRQREEKEDIQAEGINVIGRRMKENDRQKRLLVSHLARVDVLT